VTPTRLVHITSLDQLRTAAPLWDDLWWRSEVTLPTARAELLAQWIEQFTPRADFHALAVENDRQWVAALPLVGRRLGRVIRAGTMPSNQWSLNGELLLDQTAEVDCVLDLLVQGIGELPWQLLWLDEVVLPAPRWKALLAAMDRAGMATERHQRFQVGLIEIDHDWEACKKRWSKKHRSKIQKAARRLEEKYDVQFEMCSQFAPQEVERHLCRAFEIEDRSWKGKAGTSVLRTPGIFDFYVRRARQLAEWGQLELAFLHCNQRPIAFVCGFNTKGVCHWCKIGYDPEYRLFSPGQLLQYYILEQVHGEGECRAVDCLGPMTDALSKWKPTTYEVGRLVVAPRRLAGRVVLHAYKRWWPQIRRLRGCKKLDEPANQSGRKAPSGTEERVPERA